MVSDLQDVAVQFRMVGDDLPLDFLGGVAGEKPLLPHQFGVEDQARVILLRPSVFVVIGEDHRTDLNRERIDVVHIMTDIIKPTKAIRRAVMVEIVMGDEQIIDVVNPFLP